MNGTLAWMQTTGMPMRPAMSTMMTAEVPPTDAAEAGLDVRLHVPDATRAGVPTTVTATVVDVETGEPVRDLNRSHEAWMHLIATRQDLGTFAHVHPEPTGRPGELQVEMTFPTAGDYIVNTEFRSAARWPTSINASWSRSPAPRRSTSRWPRGHAASWSTASGSGSRVRR